MPSRAPRDARNRRLCSRISAKLSKTSSRKFSRRDGAMIGGTAVRKGWTKACARDSRGQRHSRMIVHDPQNSTHRLDKAQVIVVRLLALDQLANLMSQGVDLRRTLDGLEFSGHPHRLLVYRLLERAHVKLHPVVMSRDSELTRERRGQAKA